MLQIPKKPIFGPPLEIFSFQYNFEGTLAYIVKGGQPLKIFIFLLPTNQIGYLFPCFLKMLDYIWFVKFLECLKLVATTKSY